MNRREMLTCFGTAGMGFTLGGMALAAGDHSGNAAHAGSPPGPLHAAHAHFCGIHIAKKDPKFQIITQHFCAAHTTGEHGDTIFQCLLFDNAATNAKLLGVEYVIPDKTYRQLSDGEKKYWHPHTYEVLGGMLIAPEMDPVEEQKFMKTILTTWGKAWHTWPDPDTAVPIGEPLLIWALTGDAQADASVVAKRDRQYNVSTGVIRERRGRELGLQAPQVSLPSSIDAVGRQWADDGDDVPTRRN